MVYKANLILMLNLLLRIYVIHVILTTRHNDNYVVLNTSFGSTYWFSQSECDYFSREIIIYQHLRTTQSVQMRIK
jgi:hypothetical protein